MEKSKPQEEETFSPSPPLPLSPSPQIQWIALVTILLVAAVFRFYGIGWDSGYLFHPDERKIVLVASGLGWPSSFLEIFSSESPLNPKFFAYGSFPIYLLRALSILAPSATYGVPWREDYFVALGMLGRVLSALFDLGTIAMVFFLGRRLFDATVGLIASACIALTVLHIQLAHFYAVDTLLTFLVVATVFFAARFAATGTRRDALLMAVGFGLALATKVTAAPLIVPIVVAVVKARGAPLSDNHQDTKTLTQRILGVLVPLWLQVWSTRRTLAKIVGVAFVVFVVTQPYAVLDPIRYFGQVGTEALVARGWLDFPYTRQYAGTLPFVYPIAQSAIWGMGLPLGIFGWAGTALFVWQWWRTRGVRRLRRSRLRSAWAYGFILSWALVYFLSVSAQHAKYLRYLLPLLPFLFLMAAVGLKSQVAGLKSQVASLKSHGSRISFPYLRFRFHVSRFTCYALLPIVALSSLLYSLAFVSTYTRQHPWLQISEWIYRNVPAGATIVTEQWDDLLPMPARVNGELRPPSDYNIQQLPMYDADDAAKLEMIAATLAKSDYVLLASQRLYATIPRLPARYPASARYYSLLFGGELGFELVAFARNEPALGGITIVEDTFSDPWLPIPRLLAANRPVGTVWNWGRADESFTVYDHPMPLLFKKTRALSAADILALLNGQ